MVYLSSDPGFLYCRYIYDIPSQGGTWRIGLPGRVTDTWLATMVKRKSLKDRVVPLFPTNKWSFHDVFNGGDPNYLLTELMLQVGGLLYMPVAQKILLMLQKSGCHRLIW